MTMPRILAARIHGDPCGSAQSMWDAPPFIPWDIEVAEYNFGANCGPTSFAAIAGREVCRVMQYFEHFEHSSWTNLTQMRRAFDQAGYAVTVHKRQLPPRGVALVQWLGPWTESHFFSRWSLRHTHWVAVDRDWIFDYGVGDWQPLPVWEKETAAAYLANIPEAGGWAVKYGVEVISSQTAWLGSNDSMICSSGGVTMRRSS